MADQRNPFADRLTAYKPTLRDQARNIFANGGYEARRFAQNLFGAPGHMGLLDWTPVGTAFGLEEAGRKLTTPGQRLSGGADIALAMVPMPAAAKGAKKLKGAKRAKAPAATLDNVFAVDGIPKPPSARITDAVPGELRPRSSFAQPLVPTAKDMQQYGRVEEVPLNMVEAHERDAYRRWGDFKAGKHPGSLVEGYGDLPLAVKLNDGSYLLYDGHHRTALMSGRGDQSAKMFVIDAAKYDPENAGKSLTPQPSRSEIDEMLAALGLK